MKRVLLIVIDALSSRHVQEAFSSGRLPHLRRLVELGTSREECTAVFPSITPAATASLITGCYPVDHGIPGAFFYHRESDRVHYLGDDIWPILHDGFGEYFRDFLVRLNQSVLRQPTLFERVEAAGRRASCLNYIFFHGIQRHDVTVPWLLRLLPGVPRQAVVAGPERLYLGDLVDDEPDDIDAAEGDPTAPGGPLHRFGFNDESTAAMLLLQAHRGDWPDLTVAYFPENDFESHRSGPSAAIETVQRVDDHLGELFEESGGVESLLRRVAILITGDHSQSDLVEDTNARGINLDDVLAREALVPAGSAWDDEEQLMVCPNMRACQLYLRGSRSERLSGIVAKLAADERVDQVIWRETSKDDGDRFHVVRRDDEELTFWIAGADVARGEDAFGNRWNWTGTLAPVEAEVSPSGRIGYGPYPNALERIATSFPRPTAGDIWATARVGYEFHLPETSVHRRGSHGSLHALDSTSPLIFAGASEDDALRSEHVRTTDVADVCRRVLGIE
ncbi:MAG: alkaline phosphatase family protein [Pirellulales bacterium]